MNDHTCISLVRRIIVTEHITVNHTMAMYDCIVIGAGIMGSSTAYHLSKTGSKTLMIEQVNDYRLHILFDRIIV